MFAFALAALFVVVHAEPQAPAAPQPAAPVPAPILIGTPPPPATALEAFHAEPGTILTTSYEVRGEVEGVFVEARESRDSQNARARGIVVTFTDKNADPQEAYIDPDEFASLLNGFDALLAITINPS